MEMWMDWMKEELWDSMKGRLYDSSMEMWMDSMKEELWDSLKGRW
jgi:hypothetical protein